MATAKYKLLFIEDNEFDQMAFERFVEKSENFDFIYTVSQSVKESLELLQSEKFDIILSDFELGDGNAFEILEKKWNLPFVIITASGNEEIAVKAMKLGAYDYIIKDIDGYYFKILPATLTNAILRYKSEQDLKQYQQNLEILVQKRTLELEKAKLKAEESDRLKTIFLENMNHEIRTPLNSILGFANLLNESDLEKQEIKRYVQIINNSGKRLLNIISDIIHIAEIHSNQLKTNIAPLIIGENIMNILENFRRSELFLIKDKIQLIDNISDECFKTEILTDQDLLQQVMENLISNALKFTTEGTIEVGCTIKNSLIEFYVSDTGKGIEEKFFDLIFKRFRQIEENEYHDGTGLGLSISKGIVELLGGKIWVNSEINVGSTFKFTIPVALNQTKENKTPDPARTSFNTNTKTIIIAEDDYYSFVLVNEILNKMNLKILHVKNGVELLKTLETEKPDLILLDLKMPLKNGYECFDEIKKKGIQTKIIAQTAFTMEDDRQKCLDLGFDNFITKPISKNTLLKTINETLLD